MTPDWTCGMLQFASGPLGRLTTNFYVGPSKQAGLEFHGDIASLHLASAVESNAAVQMRRFEQWQWSDVPPVSTPFAGIEWGRGVSELADAIAQGRPHRVTGGQAAHVVEVIDGLLRSGQSHQPVQIASRFAAPLLRRA